MKKYKYIILDFGNVLAYPVTGHWFITEKFKEFVDINRIGLDKINNAMKKNGEILSRKIVSLDEEVLMYYDFYKNTFKELDYQLSDESIKEIAYDITHNDNKCSLYDGVNMELDELSKKYELLLLSDNWPCAFRIMKNFGIDKYFKKLYISSIYGVEKKDGVFFDYPIKEFNIKKGEALFIDDNEKLLDVAVTKGLDVKLMNREVLIDSKYEVINNLLNI